MDEIRDKVFESLNQAQVQLEESELYQKIRERYESLSSVAQKIVLGLVFFLIAYTVFQIPMAFYSRASENLALFEENRNLVLDLYAIKQKANSAPPAAPTMDNSMLESRARSAVMGARVQNEQIKAISFFDNAGPGSNKLIPKSIRQNGVEIRLANLNLTQIIDISHGLSNIGATTKIVGFQVKPGSALGNYFDVIFKVVSFDIPISTASGNDKANRK